MAALPMAYPPSRAEHGRGPGGTIVPAASPQDSTPMRTFG